MKTYPEKRNEKLTELYKKIPPVNCPEDCTKCCGPVPLSPSEAAVLGKKRLFTDWDKETMECEFCVDNKCSVYEDRPFICRIFGCESGGLYKCPVVCHRPCPMEESEALRLTEEYFYIASSEEGFSMDMIDEVLTKAMKSHERKMGWAR